MEFITSLSKSELEQMISAQVTKCLDDKLAPSQPEQADRIALDDAVLLTGLSKPTLYKLTHSKRIPHSKFGSKLIFSRRQLQAWVEDRTLPPSSPETEMKEKLAAAAKKHLRNALQK